MVNESLPPLINFSEYEVFSIINTITETNLSKEEAFKLFQDKLKDKGRKPFDPNSVPDGAMM